MSENACLAFTSAIIRCLYAKELSAQSETVFLSCTYTDIRTTNADALTKTITFYIGEKKVG